jgi:NAD(P)-dependent dehydrogenase (short-subunit alcohol dehydrogenase family)
MLDSVPFVSGKVVAISGGARGIGLATARAFAADGAQVAVGDVDRVVEPGLTAYRLDVTDAGSFERFVKTVERDLGPLDVLVNNAGVDWMAPFTRSRTRSPAGRSRSTCWARSSARGWALARMLPREAVLLGLGIARLTEDTDAEARRDYHRRMFGAG